jgi:hypothetical protein
MNPLSDLQIDEVILSVAEASWTKVALVIAKVADTMGSGLPEGDAAYNLIARRIEILVPRRPLVGARRYQGMAAQRSKRVKLGQYRLSVRVALNRAFC